MKTNNPACAITKEKRSTQYGRKKDKGGIP